MRLLFFICVIWIDQAKKAFELRNEYRTAAREFMKDNVWKEFLEQTEGNKTWEQLLENTLKKVEVNGVLDKAYSKIIESSRTGRDDFDDLFQIPEEKKIYDK